MRQWQQGSIRLEFAMAGRNNPAAKLRSLRSLAGDMGWLMIQTASFAAIAVLGVSALLLAGMVGHQVIRSLF
jgi:hypothetical protein